MLSSIKLFAHRTSLVVVATLVLVAYPTAVARADTTPATTPSTTTESTGPTTPTGADAKTYTYNASTGLWENQYYTWNPATNQTTPKTSQDYSYNPATKAWDTTNFKYDPVTKTYVPNIPAPAPTVAPASSPTTGNSDTTSGTGPDSNNTTTSTGTNDQTYNGFYDASISNRIASQATTGNAGVLGNTTGGSATTGNATDTATILNLLQSTTSFNGGNVTTFTTDLNGSITGDLLIDPALIATLQPANANTTGPTNLTINSANSAAITNDISLGATTGDASVANNTTAGDATSGDANAVANVVNVANSTLSAGQTFIGTINIYGDLNGDILLPANMLQSLISSNTAPTGSTSSSATTGSTLGVNNASAQSIANNVVASAITGTASTVGNTSAGSANTGNAATNVTLLNLTGHQIVGANSLLVFVNVLGNWVGLIMDAPTGATAAALAGGVTSDTVAPTNENVTTNNNTAITNNVSVAATSGNAAVSNNTTGGDATSGNATASANILNIANDDLALSNWFGVLFINVFGIWDGSFGVNTSAGNVATTGGSSTSTSGNGDTSNNTNTTTTGNIDNSGNDGGLGLVLASQTTTDVPGSSTTTPDTTLVASKHKAVLGAATTVPAQHASNTNWQLPAVGLGISALLLGVERILSYRKKMQA